MDYYHNALIPDIKSGNKIIDNNYENDLGTLTITLRLDTYGEFDSDYTDLVVEINSECTNSIKWLQDNLGVDLTEIAVTYYD